MRSRFLCAADGANVLVILGVNRFPFAICMGAGNCYGSDCLVCCLGAVGSFNDNVELYFSSSDGGIILNLYVEGEDIADELKSSGVGNNSHSLVVKAILQESRSVLPLALTVEDKSLVINSGKFDSHGVGFCGEARTCNCQGDGIAAFGFGNIGGDGEFSVVSKRSNAQSENHQSYQHYRYYFFHFFIILSLYLILKL